jgi:hypothetical protein
MRGKSIEEVLKKAAQGWRCTKTSNQEHSLLSVNEVIAGISWDRIVTCTPSSFSKAISSCFSNTTPTFSKTGSKIS